MGVLKPNQREYCRAKNINCKNFSGRWHFLKLCKKTAVNQVVGLYEITNYESNVMWKFDEQHDDHNFEIFVIRKVLDKDGRKNKEKLNIKMCKSRWQTEFQIDNASPVSFILQAKLPDWRPGVDLWAIYKFRRK